MQSHCSSDTERKPTFIGIGAPKCGSTSIHHYLGEHPDVFVSNPKETHFFNHEVEARLLYRIKDQPAYLALFAVAGQEKALGEFSPTYLLNPRCARRIKEALPDVKLIVTLRSPTRRAYSAWVGAVRVGLESEPAEVAIRPGSRHLDEGFYSQLLQPYFELFDRERIKILVFEDLAAKPLETMSELYDFLEVDPSFKPNVSVHHNPASVPKYPQVNHAWQTIRRALRSWIRMPDSLIRLHEHLLEKTYSAAPKLDDQLRSTLQVHYQEEVERMEVILGRNLDVWRS